jgi:hypothetical protein
MTTRKCNTCDQDKPLDQFRTIKVYLNHKCRECERDANRQYMRGYRKQRTAEKRAQRLATTTAKPTGSPSYQQRVEALEAQIQSLLAFASLHGYNTTET